MQDATLMFSIKQEITSSAPSDYFIPLNELSNHEALPMRCSVVVTEDFATCDGLDIQLMLSKGTNAETDTSNAVLMGGSQTIPVSLLKAGKSIPIILPMTYTDIVENYANYNKLVLNYKVNGSSATSGAVTAGLEIYPQTNI